MDARTAGGGAHAAPAAAAAAAAGAHAAGTFLHPKAGMVGVDRARVARVVHEASRGSLYSARAEAKEAALTARIAELQRALQQRPRAELDGLDAAMQRLRARMEQARRTDRVRAVCDFDMFFAAVEARDDPSLAGVPFAVGGLAMISTASYAARKFGVRSAMPGFIALKLCPQLRFVEHRFDRYEAASAQGRAVFERYDPRASMLSLDEVRMDLTEHLLAQQQQQQQQQRQQRVGSVGREGGALEVEEQEEQGARAQEEQEQAAPAPPAAAAAAAAGTGTGLHPPPPGGFSAAAVEAAVAAMRRDVAAATGGLTVSAGVAASSLLAKIVSDINKPDGQFLLLGDAAAIVDFMRALPVRKLPGVGKVTERLLVELGFATCGDVLDRPGVLRAALGERSAAWLLRSALGLDEGDFPLGGGGGGASDDAAAAVGRKSISQERTFADCASWAELAGRVGELGAAGAAQMQAEGIVGRTVTLKLKHATFHVSQKQTSLRRPAADAETLCRVALALLRAAWPATLRLIGVRVSGLAPAATKPTMLEAYFGRAGGPPGGGAAPAAARARGAGGNTSHPEKEEEGHNDGNDDGDDDDDDDDVVEELISGGSGGSSSSSSCGSSGGGAAGSMQTAPSASGGAHGWAHRAGAGGAPPPKAARFTDPWAAAALGGRRGGGGAAAGAAAGGRDTDGDDTDDCEGGDVEVIELLDDDDDDASGHDAAGGGGGDVLVGQSGEEEEEGGRDEVIELHDSQPDTAPAARAPPPPPPPPPRLQQPLVVARRRLHGGGGPGTRSCPVCAHALGATLTSAEVNAHVDACLAAASARRATGGRT